MMHVIDMWNEITSRCDAITCVNLILSNKYLYENFKHELPKYRYLTMKVVSRSTRGLNMFKDPYVWKKITNSGVSVNKVYIQCSKGGIAKNMWVNLSHVDLCNFLKFLKFDIMVHQTSWPKIEDGLNILNCDELGRKYINHCVLDNGQLQLEWIDDLMGRSMYIVRDDSSDTYLKTITKSIEERLSVENDNFDMNIYCAVKSRRRIRLNNNRKKGNNDFYHNKNLCTI